MEVAVGISGRIGSGKSTLATELAEQLSCPRASFGDYVRSVVSNRGSDPTRRELLQKAGDELIAEGWEAFCSAVLASAGYSGGSVVVEGIRHPQASETTRALVAPIPWRLIAVDTEESARRARLATRGVDDTQVVHADSHPNESEVGLVMASADFVVSSDSTVDASATEVMQWLVATVRTPFAYCRGDASRRNKRCSAGPND